jgi:asparagine synthase (glutamine-hydrolysing)
VCGIAGWVDWERDLTRERATVQAMTEVLAPRGPDAAGLWVSARVAIGHRRLSVVDIEGGVQPMVTGEHPCVVAYNGEVYNFRELRRLLEAEGHAFRTRSDTEVVLRAYVAWGTACVARFRGMFALAVWDAAREELVLIRDRLGVKPLYYVVTPTGALFGSEIKALLANPLVAAEIDADGLAELLLFTATPGHAIYRGIRAVVPGTCVRIGRAGRREERYWQLESRPHTDDLQTTVSTVRGLLEEAVTGQLIADVPWCTLLSGGLDSSAVTALAALARGRMGDAGVNSAGIDYEASEEHFRPTAFRPDRDAPYAWEVARHVGSRHTQLVFTPSDIMDARAETMRARDLPACFADIAASEFLLFREVRGSATVALSGEGADEVFGGYPWFHDVAALSAPTFPWTRVSRELLSVLSPDLVAAMKPDEFLLERHAQAIAEVPRLEGEGAADVRVREMFYVNLTRWLHMLLEYADRMSMRSGLELRVPFCDHKLIEYVWNAPWSYKTAADREKGLLREATRDLLPAAVVRRRKSSFPINDDPRYDAALRTQLRERLTEASSPLHPLVDRERLLGMIRDEPYRPGGVWRLTDTLAALIQMDDWLRAYRVRLV